MTCNFLYFKHSNRRKWPTKDIGFWSVQRVHGKLHEDVFRWYCGVDGPRNHAWWTLLVQSGRLVRCQNWSCLLTDFYESDIRGVSLRAISITLAEETLPKKMPFFDLGPLEWSSGKFWLAKCRSTESIVEPSSTESLAIDSVFPSLPPVLLNFVFLWSAAGKLALRLSWVLYWNKMSRLAPLKAYR